MNPLISFRKLIPYLILFTALTGFDRLTKVIAQETIAHSLPRSYAGDTFRFQYAENRGGFLSLGANLSASHRSVLFVGVSAAGLLMLALFGFRGGNHTRSHNYALTLVVGGGVSNLLDRIFFDGIVVDFMNAGIGSLRTGIFNFADTFIMAGAGWLLLQYLRRRPSKEDLPEGSGENGEVEPE